MPFPAAFRILKAGQVAGAVMLVLITAAASALSAVPVEPVPDPLPDSNGGRSELTGGSTGQCGSEQGPAFWIVSTECSRQSFDRSCPVFRPQVTFVRRCGHRRGIPFRQMLQSLRPDIPICIKVHGSFVSREGIIDEGHITYRWLCSAACGAKMQLIHFTWPSSRPWLTPTIQCDVNILGRRAARNGWYLAELIRHLPPGTPVCLIGHSHGCRLISSALHLMGGGRVQGHAHPGARRNGRPIRVVFAAAAMRHDWLNPEERYGRALCVAECLMNFRNRRDCALRLYPLRHPFSGHSLATSGFTTRDRRRLKSWSRKVAQYDVTPLIGHGHMWPNYVAHRRLAHLIRSYVYFTDRFPQTPASGAQASRQATAPSTTTGRLPVLAAADDSHQSGIPTDTAAARLADSGQEQVR